MSIRKVHIVLALALALALVAASCKAPTSLGVVSTLAGTGEADFKDGVGCAARFSGPRAIAVDSSGNVYVADYGNHRIRKVFTAEDGTVMVSTLAGSGGAGFANSAGSTAQFSNPFGVAVDSRNGNVYVADTFNYRIRKVTADGMVSTLAGSGRAGFANGAGSMARFKHPAGVAMDSRNGNVYVADGDNHRIRKVTADGVVSTLAGNGAWGFADGSGSEAQFNNPTGVAVDSSGNVYVADYGNHCIRKVTIEDGTVMVSTLAGSGRAGFVNGTGRLARFNNPAGVAVDSSGNVYVADYANNRIRKVTITGNGVRVSTLAGSKRADFADGAGREARFNSPYGVAVDSSGNVYVADYSNNLIRKIEFKVP